MLGGLQPRDLGEFELDRGFAAEDVDEDLDLELVFVDLYDLAREVGERTFLDPNSLAHFVLETSALALVGRSWSTLFFDVEEVFDFTAKKRRWLAARANKVDYRRRVSNNVPSVVVEMCTYEQVARCLLYTSPSPRDQRGSRMPSSA